MSMGVSQNPKQTLHSSS